MMLGYIVALSFAEGGPICCNALIAPSPEAAAALYALKVRDEGVSQPLNGVVVTALADADFLRNALRAVEGKLPESGTAQVLSLVPRDPPKPVLYDHEFGQPVRLTPYQWSEKIDPFPRWQR